MTDDVLAIFAVLCLPVKEFVDDFQVIRVDDLAILHPWPVNSITQPPNDQLMNFFGRMVESEMTLMLTVFPSSETSYRREIEPRLNRPSSSGW